MVKLFKKYFYLGVFIENLYPSWQLSIIETFDNIKEFHPIISFSPHEMIEQAAYVSASPYTQ